jgi:hypothetical protein
MNREAFGEKLEIMTASTVYSQAGNADARNHSDFCGLADYIAGWT